MSNIVEGSVVVVKSNHQIENELQQGQHYLVSRVEKVGKDHHDWYLHLVGVTRKDKTGFCFNRFELEEDEQVASAYRQGIEAVLDLSKSLAFFGKVAQWKAYREAIESLVPILRVE